MKIEGFNRSLAFLVSVDRYGHGVPALQTPVADADALAKVLREEHGFECEVIADEQATLHGLRSFLKKLPSRVSSDDRVIFYFAGHGIAVESDDGPKGFILPQDAQRDSENNYLPMAELDEALSVLPCRHMLLILDCCFAGAFRWSSFRHLALSPENLHQERYNWFIKDPAWQAIASAAHDQKALDVAAENPLGKRDDTQQDHSPFARALIDGLKGHADRAPVGGKGDGVITATELYQHIDDQLRLSPSSKRLRQTPILWPLKKHDKGQFVFLVPGKALHLPPAPQLDPNANPWRGLSPYEEKHEKLFYGRGAAADRLAVRLLGKKASEGQPAIPAERFIVVTGPSGIGKSSLVKAGLLPRLPNERIRSIIVRPSTPGPTPFASLAAALKKGNSSDEPAPDENTLKADPDSLTQWVKAQNKDREVLLVVDQAEELITMNNKEAVAAAFIQLIANALDHTEQGLRVVFTVRSEFEPQFAQSPLKNCWPTARYLVPQMTQDELRRVIEGPATVKVMRFESTELVDTLVNEVVNMPGALPLLSFALSQMYRHYLDRRGTDRAITQVDYDALQGGVTGSLRIRANQLVDEGDELSKQTARRVLERFVSIEAGEFARRRVPRWEFEVDNQAEQARINHILARLDEERLIITDGPTRQSLENGHNNSTSNVLPPSGKSQTFLEFAHDALILGWDRLLNWIREDTEVIADLRRLTKDASIWINKDKKTTGPFWDEPDEVKIIAKLSSWAALGLSITETKFRDASLASAERIAATQKRRLVILSIITIVAVSAAIFAIWGQILANERLLTAQLNESEVLASQSRTLAERGDSVSAMLVALKGLPTQFDPMDRPILPSAMGALLEALAKKTELFLTAAPGYPEEKVITISYNSTGAEIIGISDWGKLYRWSSTDGQLLHTLASPHKKISDALLGQEGRRVILIDLDGSVYSWDTVQNTTRRLPVTQETIDGAVDGIVASLDTNPERLLHIPGNSKKGERLTTLLDIPSGKVVEKIRYLGYPVSFAIRNGKLNLFASFKGGNHVWDAQDGRPLPELPEALKEPYILIPAFNSDVIVTNEPTDLATLVSGTGADNTRIVRKMRLDGGTQIYVSNNGHWLASRNTQVALSLTESSIKIRSLESSEDAERLLNLPWFVPTISFSADGRQLAGRLRDGRIVAWSSNRDATWFPWFSTRFNGGQSSATFIRGTPLVASSGIEVRRLPKRAISGVLTFWNVNTFAIEKKIYIPTDDWIDQLRSSKDGKYLVATTSPKEPKIWRVDLPSLTITGVDPLASIDSTVIALLPEDNGLVVGGTKGEIIAIDILTGATLATYSSRLTGRITVVATGQQHSRTSVAASSENGNEVFVWPSPSSSPRILTGHNNPLSAISIGNDTIVTADQKGQINVFKNVETRPSISIVSRNAQISALDIDSQNKRMAAGSDDGFIRIIDLESGQLMLEFRANQRSIRSVEFSSDDRSLLVAGEDHATRVWPINLTQRELIESAKASLPDMKYRTASEE